jgi:L-seryl-tRNA(Ser) seleniumtransferase
MRVQLAQRVVEDARRKVNSQKEAGDVEAEYRDQLRRASRRLLRPVLNATGVLLHTNLGRAPTTVRAHGGWSNIEYDLDEGARGSRHRHAATLAANACGAEAAIVVNNNAAAVLLGLAAIAAGRDVLVSRGEAIEIGGGFRIPEILAASGARLVDVGTTNRTRVEDYTAAVSSRTGAILSVHPSNFAVRGFVERPGRVELAQASHHAGVPFLSDLGSGLLDAGTPWLPRPPRWLKDEPGARQAIAEGADLVFFSGDKLLGGPQAGIAAGRADLVEAMRVHPLARALRIDKLRLFVLQETLLAYLDHRVTADVPFWRMAMSDPAARAAALAGALGAGVEPGESLIGAGSAPEASIPTTVVRWQVADPEAVTACLRNGDPPVIVRIERDAVVIDLRTIEPSDDEELLSCLKSCAP